jgi:hypothetical protein
MKLSLQAMHFSILQKKGLLCIEVVSSTTAAVELPFSTMPVAFFKHGVHRFCSGSSIEIH